MLFLRVVPADLVCFSVTQTIPTDDYQRLTEACREGSSGAVVISGGQGVDRDAATAAGALVVADMATLASHIEGL